MSEGKAHRPRRPRKTAATEGARPGGAPPTVNASVCLCGGLGPLLTQALRTLTVPEEVKRSVHETEREALRLLRTLVEMRLSTLGPDDARPREPARGVKVDVS